MRRFSVFVTTLANARFFGKKRASATNARLPSSYGQHEGQREGRFARGARRSASQLVRRATGHRSSFRHARAADAVPCSARSARSSRAPVAAVRPAKAVLAGGFRIAAASAAARPTAGVVRLAAGGVRCAVAESTKEESFTYQAEARALAAAARLEQPDRRAVATDTAAAAAHASHPRFPASRRSTGCWTSSSTACTATKRCAAAPSRPPAARCGSCDAAALRVAAALSGARPDCRAPRCSCASLSATRPTRSTRFASSGAPARFRALPPLSLTQRRSPRAA